MRVATVGWREINCREKNGKRFCNNIQQRNFFSFHPNANLQTNKRKNVKVEIKTENVVEDIVIERKVPSINEVYNMLKESGDIKGLSIFQEAVNSVVKNSTHIPHQITSFYYLIERSNWNEANNVLTNLLHYYSHLPDEIPSELSKKNISTQINLDELGTKHKLYFKITLLVGEYIRKLKVVGNIEEFKKLFFLLSKFQFKKNEKIYSEILSFSKFHFDRNFFINTILEEISTSHSSQLLQSKETPKIHFTKFLFNLYSKFLQEKNISLHYLDSIEDTNSLNSIKEHVEIKNFQFFSPNEGSKRLNIEISNIINSLQNIPNYFEQYNKKQIPMTSYTTLNDNLFYYYYMQFKNQQNRFFHLFSKYLRSKIYENEIEESIKLISNLNRLGIQLNPKVMNTFLLSLIYTQNPRNLSLERENELENDFNNSKNENNSILESREFLDILRNYYQSKQNLQEDTDQETSIFLSQIIQHSKFFSRIPDDDTQTLLFLKSNDHSFLFDNPKIFCHSLSQFEGKYLSLRYLIDKMFNINPQSLTTSSYKLLIESIEDAKIRAKIIVEMNHRKIDFSPEIYQLLVESLVKSSLFYDVIFFVQNLKDPISKTTFDLYVKCCRHASISPSKTVVVVDDNLDV